MSYGFEETQDLDPLRRLSDLENLDVSDFSPLGDLYKLKLFKAKSLPQLVNVDFFSGIRTLEEVDLSHSNVQDIDGLLSSAGSIVKLNLAHSKIRDINALMFFRNLQELNLSSTSVVDFRSLRGLGNLRTCCGW